MKLVGGHQDDCSIVIYIDPVKYIDPKTLAFENNCKIIINNTFQEHTAKRYLSSTSKDIIIPIVISTTTASLNPLPFIWWTVLGTKATLGFIGFLLCLFHKFEIYRYENNIRIFYPKSLDTNH